MKNRLCPHCQQPLTGQTAWDTLKQSEFQCDSCGKPSRLSTFGLNLIFVIFVALAILIVNRIGYTMLSIALCAGAVIVYILATLYWIPVIPTSPNYSSTRSQEQPSWYKLPVIWIGIVLIAVVWGWWSLGLE